MVDLFVVSRGIGRILPACEGATATWRIEFFSLELGGFIVGVVPRITHGI